MLLNEISCDELGRNKRNTCDTWHADGEHGSCHSAFAQNVERDAMAPDRRRNPAIEGNQQQNVANLVCRAAVGERTVDVDAKLVGAPDRLTPSDRGDISQTTAAIMTSGWMSVERSVTSVAGIIRVLAGPPGASALTVTPVPARSFAQMTVAASSAALDGP